MSVSSSVAPEDSIDVSILIQAFFSNGYMQISPVPILSSKSRSSSKSGLLDVIPNIVSGLFGSPRSSSKVGILVPSDETIVVSDVVTPVASTNFLDVDAIPASVKVKGTQNVVTQEKLDSWSFNVLEYSADQLCEIMAMPFLVWNLLDEFKVPKSAFMSFMHEISGIYLKNNFYHNFKHGCDVTHTTYRLLSVPRLHEVLPKLDLFGILISAIAHDVGHLGVNNMYLINSKHELAQQYPVSPLENLHCAKLFEILGKVSLL